MIKRNITRKILAITLAMSLLATTASANDFIGGGAGGDYESAVAGDCWNGDEGVRVSVVSAKAPYTTIACGDFSDTDTSAINTRFGPVSIEVSGAGQLSKFDIMQDGFELSDNTYISIQLDDALPGIIDGNITDVKDYFLGIDTLNSVCNKLGTTSDKIISGEYNLVMEPIAYFTFGYVGCALTATEAALYNKALNSIPGFPTEYNLRRRMGHLTHKNLPLSMYLPKSEMGIPAYTGGVNFMPDDFIADNLGICILIGADFGGAPPKPNPPPVKPPPSKWPDDVTILSEYLNDKVDRVKVEDAPTVTAPNNGSITSGPNMTSSTSTQNFTSANIYNGLFNLSEWGLKDSVIVDRGITSSTPVNLKVAAQVHSSTPDMVGWLGAPVKTRQTPERVWDTYRWVNVNGHIEPIDYSYSYKYYVEDVDHEDCDCTTPPFHSNHDSDNSYWATGSGSGQYSVVVSGFNYTSEDTAFNSPITSSLTTTNRMSFDKNQLRGHYTGAVTDTDATYKFYPYYAMKYYNGSRGIVTPLWMLATGERTLKTKDVIDIDFKMSGNTQMIAPWSRDKFDSDNKPSTVMNVLKAGSAVQVVPKPITGSVKYTYYTNDEGFISTPGTISIKPEAISAFENMFQPDAIDLAAYSNVPLTGSLMPYGLDCTANNGIVEAGTIASYKQKPRPGAINTVKRFDNSSIKVTITRNNSLTGEQATCKSAVPSHVSIAGRNVPVTYQSGKLPFMDAIGMPASSLLQKGLDVNNNTLLWYKEEYEGILKVEITGDFTMQEDINNSTWFEVYPHVSDWRTPYNTKQNNFNTSDGDKSKPIYRGTDFIFGVGLALNPAHTPNGNTIFIPNPAYTDPFQIRGSVFDTTH